MININKRIRFYRSGKNRLTILQNVHFHNQIEVRFVSNNGSLENQESFQATTVETPQLSKEEIRFNILSNALKYVPVFGWTHEALCAGARDSGFPEVSHGYIENGPIDLVYFFVDHCNESLNREAATLNLERYSLRERIKILLTTRIGYILPYINRWADAMALMANPLNLPTSISKMATLVDDIWYLAGDQSSDHSWYIKRGMLGTVYSSTVLFMLSDGSKDHKETWDFLDRRLEDFVSATKCQSDVEASLGFVGNFVESIISSVSTVIHASPQTKQTEMKTEFKEVQTGVEKTKE